MATFRTADVERERPDEEFTVECANGNVYTLPHPKSIPADELINLNVNDVPAALMALLGDDYYDFSHEKEMDGFALDAILEAWMSHYGLEVDRGKGSRSQRRSTVTPKRSKRTSAHKASRS